jgi:hypothetical protein
MLQRMIDDFKSSTGSAMRQTALAAMLVLSSFVALAFLCVAGFVIVLDRYGLVEACLAGAVLFLLITLIFVSVHTAYKRQIEARAEERAKSTAHALLSDPVMVATAIQIVRAIGVKRLLPILAVGGLALGLLAGRNNASHPAGEEAPAE